MTYAIPGGWAQHAACANRTALMEVPTNRRRESRRKVDAARTLCHGCPVLEPCQAWALTTPDPADYMVAGGLTPRQRTDLRDLRNAS